jgi:hypothetical protein
MSEWTPYTKDVTPVSELPPEWEGVLGWVILCPKEERNCGVDEPWEPHIDIVSWFRGPRLNIDDPNPDITPKDIRWDTSNGDWCVISHWMPLPEPPK